MESGKVVDQRFRIEELAGEGGMGAVYRAKDLHTGANVAIKVLRQVGETEAERFSREIKVLERLEHPAIVRCLGHGTLPEGKPWLAMEWVEGEDLEKRLARGHLSPSEAIALARAVAGALAEAHALGVIHRDIKPGNILLARGEPAGAKLIDFGLARVAGAHAATISGALLGTPAYMPPEQIRGAHDVDRRADLYSLGVVLFECLTGKRPFVSGSDVIGVITSILFQSAPRLAEVAPALPSALDKLLAALLEKDPANRPDRAEEVLEALEAIDVEEPRSHAPTTERPALTEGEMRLVSVVLLARTPAAGGSPLDDTVLDLQQDKKLLCAIRRVVEPLGGRVEGLGDGTVIVVLGSRGAATDQAALAARCALGIRALEAGRPIALCTGRGYVSSGSLCSDAAVRAQALVREAAPADTSIAIDEATRGLLDARFSVERQGERFVLTAEDPFGEPVRRLLGRPAPFVGREREVAFVERLFEDVLGEPRSGAALIVGEAGAGKSRLAREVLAALKRIEPSVEIWIGRGDPVSSGAPFGLIAQAIRGAASLRDGEAPEVRQEKLLSWVKERVDGPRLKRVAGFLGELVGALKQCATEDPSLRAARHDPVVMGDQIRLAFEDLVSATSASRPVVLALEDLHWGDVPTVKIVDQVLRNLHAQPFFVLALGRPEVRETFPGIWAERGVQVVLLSGLSKRAATSFVRKSLGEGAREDVVAAIVDRGAGHPLFLEELVRAAAEGAASDAPALSESVIAMVQSRVERVPPEARRVLRAASVFGETFWRGGVAALIGEDHAGRGDVDRLLGLLLDRELIEARREARFPGEVEYAFRHALFREAAYAMLTAEDRATGHHLAGAFLEGAGEARAAVLAEHFDRAGEARRAEAYHLRAARDALEGGDFEAVDRHSNRAIAGGALGEALGEALALQAEAAQWRGSYGEAARLSMAAMEVVGVGTRRWFEAVAALAIAAGRRLDYEKLAELAAALIEIGRQGEASDAYLYTAVRTGLQVYISGKYEVANSLIEPLWPLVMDGSRVDFRMRGTAEVLQGSRASIAWRFDATVRHYLQAAEIFERGGDLRSASAQRVDAAYYLTDIGRLADSLELFKETLETARRLSLSRIASVSRAGVGGVLSALGRHSEALELLREATMELDALGDMRMGGFAHLDLSFVYLELGLFDEAEKEAEIALGCLGRLPRYVVMVHDMRARIALERGDVGAALEFSEASMAAFAKIGRVGTEEIGVRRTRARVLFAAGRADEARAEVRMAKARAEWIASHFDTDDARRTFFANVEEVRLVLELAEPPASEVVTLAL